MDKSRCHLALYISENSRYVTQPLQERPWCSDNVALTAIGFKLIVVSQADNIFYIARVFNSDTHKKRNNK